VPRWSLNKNKNDDRVLLLFSGGIIILLCVDDSGYFDYKHRKCYYLLYFYIIQPRTDAFSAFDSIAGCIACTKG